MKKLVAAMTLAISMACTVFAGGIFSAEIPQEEQCITESGVEPFSLGVALDVTLGTVAVGAAVTQLVLKKTLGIPQYDGSVAYDRNAVNAFDRWAMRPFCKPLDTTADVLCVLTAGAFPALTFGLEAAFGNLSLKPLLTVGVMYAECYLLSYGVKNLLKLAVLRPRPYMYFDERDPDGISGQDWHYSWPSGHSTSAFMGATFLTYVFCSYYPRSRWKVPVIATSYAVAAGTALLRILSGNHFLTDVITGAVLGAACGFAVPFAHSLFAKKPVASKDGPVLEQLAVVPMGISATVSWRGR